MNLPRDQVCGCSRSVYVFAHSGNVFCTHCLGRRAWAPPPAGLPYAPSALGPLGFYWTPRILPPWANSGVNPSDISGHCWLGAIFPIARSTAGNGGSFLHRLATVATACYLEGCLSAAALERLRVYEYSCRWFACDGPIPGVAVYANAWHVSESWFTEATHVLSNLPLKGPRSTTPPFERAYAPRVFQAGRLVFTLDFNNLSWAEQTIGSDADFEEVPGSMAELFQNFARLIPPHHPIPISWFGGRTCGSEDLLTMLTPRALGYVSPAAVALKLQPASCWQKLFDCLSPDKFSRLVTYVEAHGEQTRWGVKSALLNRLLFNHGLRIWRHAEGRYTLSTLCTGSWQCHIRSKDEPSDYNYPVVLWSFDVREFTDPNETGKACRLPGGHKYIGGAAAAVSHDIYYSPPKDGWCGLHCLSAVANSTHGAPLRSTYNPCTELAVAHWLDNFTLSEISQEFQLPICIEVAGVSCPSAAYRMRFNNSHWEVARVPGIKRRRLSAVCIQGICQGNCPPQPPPSVGLKLRPADVHQAAPAIGAGVNWLAALRAAVNCDDRVADSEGSCDEEYRGSTGLVFRRIRYDEFRPKHAVVPPFVPPGAPKPCRPPPPPPSTPGWSTCSSAASTDSVDEFVLVSPNSPVTDNQPELEEVDLSSPITFGAPAVDELQGARVSVYNDDQVRELAELYVSSVKQGLKICLRDSQVQLVESYLSAKASEGQVVGGEEPKCGTPCPQPEKLSKWPSETGTCSSPTPGVDSSDTVPLTQNRFEVPKQRPTPMPRGIRTGVGSSKPVPAPRTKLPRAAPESSRPCITPLVQASPSDGAAEQVTCGSEQPVVEEAKAAPVDLLETAGATSKTLLERIKALRVSAALRLSHDGQRPAADAGDANKGGAHDSDCSGNARRAFLSCKPEDCDQTRPDVHGKSSKEPTKAESVGNGEAVGEQKWLIRTHNPFAGAVRGVMRHVYNYMPAVFRVVPRLLQCYNGILHGSVGISRAGACALFCCLAVSMVLVAVSPVFALLPLVLLCTRVRGRRLCFVISGMALARWIQLANTEAAVIQSCHTGAPECLELRSFIAGNILDGPVSVATIGPFGVLGSFLAGVLGGDRYGWTLVLRAAFAVDLALVIIGFISQNRCKRCLGNCIRTVKTAEIPTFTVPSTKVATAALVNYCDVVSKEYPDLVFMLTGVRGCMCGSRTLSPTSSTSYKNLDPVKVGPRTVLPWPSNVTQATAALKSVLNGASICSRTPLKVTPAKTVPFKHETFPDLPVDPDQEIIVDLPTYHLLSTQKCKMDKVVIGEGDFAAVNGILPGNGKIWANNVITPERAQIPGINLVALRNLGYAAGAIVTAVCSVEMLVSYLLGLFAQRARVCGVNTNDPFCQSPYGVPVVLSQGYCDSGACISAAGYSVEAPAIFVDSTLLTCCTLGFMAILLFCAEIVTLFDIFAPLLSIGALWYSPLQFIAAFTPVLLRFGGHRVVVLANGVFLLLVSRPAALIYWAFLVVSYLQKFVASPAIHLITPHTLGEITNNPLAAMAVANAKPGSYQHTAKTAALTGRCYLHIPSHASVLLEGKLRSKQRSANTVICSGSSCGVGTIWKRNNKHVLLTATHLAAEDKTGKYVLVDVESLTMRVDLTCKGDYAEGEIQTRLGNVYPALQLATGYQGRAYWLTASGVDVGIVTDKLAVCYTNPGDSGSAVVCPEGKFIGVHTGSNQRGFGIVTCPDGKVRGGQGKLSELVQYYDGPLVPRPASLPVNVVPDVEMIPKTLATVLDGVVVNEGALGTVNLVVAAFALWKLAHFTYAAPLTLVFFLLNETLPKIVVRSLFSCLLNVLTLTGPHGYFVLLIRLLGAALNRNQASLLFYGIGAVVSMVVEFPLLMNCTYLFVPRALMDHQHGVEVLYCVAVVHLTSVVLALCGMSYPAYVLNVDGVFDRTFFLRYFVEGAEPEGNVREAVSKSLGLAHESLTAALAINLSDADLDFLSTLVDARAVRSAKNMRTAAMDFANVSYAKALTNALHGVASFVHGHGLLARLDDFVNDVTTKLVPGDSCVVLGRMAQDEVIPFEQDGEKLLVRCQAFRNVAGVQVSICDVLAAEGVPDIKTIVHNNRKYLTIKGEVLGDFPKPECGPRQKRAELCEEDEDHISRDKWNAKMHKLAQADWRDSVRATAYGTTKGWNKAQHKIDNQWGGYGKMAEFEGLDEDSVKDVMQLVPKALTVDQAIVAMGCDQKLSESDVRKLKSLIERLQGVLTANQALNC
ncbi:ORF1a [African pouched rat arterivirus]|uniref:ORF1a n=1 Tax=African pouched rat arterivirus TaxID=1965064 RepID=A0A0B5JKI4_9NIDO|nr:ORF1a [African pouched rat arterivirus]AJG06167.1 ORF1a [African pouched rat arterivirus]